MRLKLLPIAALALASTAFLQNEGFSQGSNPLAKLEGKPAPAFKMKTLDGKTLNNANLKGKVVLLDFWATWCGPCKAASPTMQSLHTKYAKQGLVVVGANTFERGDAKAATAGYKKEHGYSYTFTYGNDQFAQALGIRGIPAFVFIGKDGKVAKTQIGFGGATAAAFESAVKKMLAQ